MKFFLLYLLFMLFLLQLFIKLNLFLFLSLLRMHNMDFFFSQLLFTNYLLLMAEAEKIIANFTS